MNFAPPRSSRPPVTVIGDIGIDLVMGTLDAWPEIGTETLMPQSEMRAGGSAGNAALALRDLGAPVRLISTVGSDPLGQWLRGQFDGIDADLHTLDGATSLSVGVLHRSGERNFLTTRGHLEAQSWNHMPPAFAGPGLALLTGAFLLPRMRTGYAAQMQALRDRGYSLALDTGWPSEGFTPEVIAETKTWLALADHILLNELEITRLAGIDNLDTAMDRLSTALRPGATLVAKVGRDVAIARRDGRTVRATPPEAGDIFDTIGAGDAFNAGYLHAIHSGADLAAALRAGCDTATRIIAQFPRNQKASAWQTGA